MDIPSSEQPPGRGANVTAENADGIAAAEVCEPAVEELPMRPVNSWLPMQRIRCMDDPEILQRVLEGLLNLI